MFAAKGYDEQLTSFVNSIRSGDETAITVRDGVRATLGCLLMIRSAQTGDPVDFDINEAL